MISQKISPIIHVGYSKAASTTLQSVFFPEHPDIHFYGKFGPEFRCDDTTKDRYFNAYAKSITQKLVNLDVFTGFSEGEISDIQAEAKKAQSEGKVFVFSNEQLCESVAPLFQARLLKELLPDAKILIVIKNQWDILLSLYKFAGYFLFFVPKRFQRSHVPLNDWLSHLIATQHNISGHKARNWISDYLRIVDYNHILTIFEQTFGAENIIVVPFEYLSASPKRFNDALCRGMNISPVVQDKVFFKDKIYNKSQSSRSMFLFHKIKTMLGIKKSFNTQLSSNFLVQFLLSRFSKKIAWNEEQAVTIAHLFSEGNAAISERYELELDKLGYPMPDIFRESSHV